MGLRKNILKNRCGESSDKLRVFEAFSGIGAQNAALKSLGVDFEVVGTSDWFVNAIIAYDALHSDQASRIDVPDYEGQLEYLEKFTFSAESQKAIKNLEGQADRRNPQTGGIDGLRGRPRRMGAT